MLKEKINKIFFRAIEFFKSFIAPKGFLKKESNLLSSDSNKKVGFKTCFCFIKNNETLRLLFWALLLSIFIRSCFYEPFHIPSSSMKPNLLVGDYIFVSKFSYGYSRHSFPFSLAPIKGRILQFQKPKHGDIIVFKCPTNGVTFVKRLVGLPGDEIQVKGGVLFINGQDVKREFVARERRGFRTFYKYTEILPGNLRHDIWEEGDSALVDNTPVFKVPQGHYFFMGDNRDNSQDSRFMNKVGYVPEENLLGRVESVFMSAREPIWKFWHWKDSIRTERIFKDVE